MRALGHDWSSWDGFYFGDWSCFGFMSSNGLGGGLLGLFSVTMSVMVKFSRLVKVCN